MHNLTFLRYQKVMSSNVRQYLLSDAIELQRVSKSSHADEIVCLWVIATLNNKINTLCKLLIRLKIECT